MRFNTVVTPFLPWLFVLASCSSPPQPPTVDESLKRPANAKLAVDLQVCRNDLQNTRLLLIDSGRVADAATARLANMVALQQLAATAQPRDPHRERGNTVFTVDFESGSTRVVVSSDIAKALIQDAKAAPLVLLRGRTGSSNETPAERRMAQKRAGALRDYLVAAGVDPARIRTTYQPVADHVADKTSGGGRSQNRRVEIELYQVLPVARSVAPITQP